ncbi:hypothetical protein FF38_12700 [Lucilia cuprina]|uniref:Uncharacterized protein n=1 Tax=Lucilia cuprina TaxID=7375 RepID=A0A0L0CA48_LUCCU|nr:hypothetical protein FF38_12700 [Lucilia cuprina]
MATTSFREMLHSNSGVFTYYISNSKCLKGLENIDQNQFYHNKFLRMNHHFPITTFMYSYTLLIKTIEPQYSSDVVLDPTCNQSVSVLTDLQHSSDVVLDPICYRKRSERIKLSPSFRDSCQKQHRNVKVSRLYYASRTNKLRSIFMLLYFTCSRSKHKVITIILQYFKQKCLTGSETTSLKKKNNVC